MTIADLVQRGNPSEGEEDGEWGNDWEGGSLSNNQVHAAQIGDSDQKAAGKAALENTQALPKNVVIIIILLLSATASFGLGYLAGRQGSQGSGLVTGSGPHSPSSESSVATLNTTSLNPSLGNGDLSAVLQK